MQCPNCGADIDPGVQYCPACGQKNTDGKITFRELLDDFFEAIFNIDSKVFRTLGGLARPGKLTIDFFKGRQKRYVNPLRLFFVSTLILFGTISFIGQKKINNLLEKEVSAVGDSFKLTAYRHMFLHELDTVRSEVEQQFESERGTASVVLDSLYKAMEDDEKDSLEINLLNSRGWSTFEPSKIRVAYEDLVRYDIEELPEKYSVDNWFGALIMRQQLKLIMNPSSFTVFLFGSFTWMVLLMMPAVAVVLKLLYIRRKIFYIEHLVFLFHYHSFAFLVLALGLLFTTYIPSLVNWITLGAAIYFLWAMKAFYRQAWWKTFIKYCLLNFSYFIILSMFFSLTILIGIFVF